MLTAGNTSPTDNMNIIISSPTKKNGFIARSPRIWRSKSMTREYKYFPISSESDNLYTPWIRNVKSMSSLQVKNEKQIINENMKNKKASQQVQKEGNMITISHSEKLSRHLSPYSCSDTKEDLTDMEIAGKSDEVSDQNKSGKKIKTSPNLRAWNPSRNRKQVLSSCKPEYNVLQPNSVAALSRQFEKVPSPNKTLIPEKNKIENGALVKFKLLAHMSTFKSPPKSPRMLNLLAKFDPSILCRSLGRDCTASSDSNSDDVLDCNENSDSNKEMENGDYLRQSGKEKDAELKRLIEQRNRDSIMAEKKEVERLKKIKEESEKEQRLMLRQQECRRIEAEKVFQQNKLEEEKQFEKIQKALDKEKQRIYIEEEIKRAKKLREDEKKKEVEEKELMKLRRIEEEKVREEHEREIKAEKVFQRNKLKEEKEGEKVQKAIDKEKQIIAIEEEVKRAKKQRKEVEERETMKLRRIEEEKVQEEFERKKLVEDFEVIEGELQKENKDIFKKDENAITQLQIESGLYLTDMVDEIATEAYVDNFLTKLEKLPNRKDIDSVTSPCFVPIPLSHMSTQSLSNSWPLHPEEFHLFMSMMTTDTLMCTESLRIRSNRKNNSNQSIKRKRSNSMGPQVLTIVPENCKHLHTQEWKFFLGD